MQRSSGFMPSVGSALLGASSALALLEVGDEALERVRPAVENQVVGQLALGSRISA